MLKMLTNTYFSAAQNKCTIIPIVGISIYIFIKKLAIPQDARHIYTNNRV